MESRQMLMLLFTVVFTVTTVQPCMVTYPWKPLTLEQTVSGADIVVFGQEAEHVHSSRWGWSTDAVFHVYCVLKNDNGPPIPEKIIVEGVWPIHSCMGTYTRLGDVMILALKRTAHGNFKWHELGIMQTAKFSPTRGNLKRATQVLGADSLRAPEGRDPQAHPSCPWPKKNRSRDDEEGQNESLPERNGSRRARLRKLKKQKWWPKNVQPVESDDTWRIPQGKGQGRNEEQGSGDPHVSTGHEIIL